jgi:hypothetical protein
MDNLYQTQQLVIDLRHSKEADARRYRLLRGNRTRASVAAQPRTGRHGTAVVARQSLARA